MMAALSLRPTQSTRSTRYWPQRLPRPRASSKGSAQIAKATLRASNLNLLTFNTTEAPLDNVKVRQAIAYAINRESMIRDLVLSQGKIAHSILPEESWAYTPGQTYHYDPAMAKKLLDEAGFRDPDGDGPQMRFSKPILFRISGSSGSARQYAGVIYNYLREVGIPVQIETSELTTLLDLLRRGQF